MWTNILTASKGSSRRRPTRDDLSVAPWIGPVETARLDQSYSESQASILRQAASILGVPVNSLSESLRNSALSTPFATIAASSAASASPQYGIDTGNTRQGFQWSFANNTNGWTNSLPEAETAPNPSSSYMYANGNTSFQEPNDPSFWSQVPGASTQTTLPFMFGTSPSNSMDQTESDSFPIFGPISPDARSSLPRQDSGASQSSTVPLFGSERTEFMFRENSSTGSDEIMPANNANGSFHWGNDMSTSSWVLPRPPEISTMDYTAEEMSNNIVEELDATKSPDVYNQPPFQFHQAPDITAQTTQPRQASPSTASSNSWVITTPPSGGSQKSSSERALTPEAYDSMLQSAAMLGPCSKTWELPPRVSLLRDS